MSVLCLVYFVIYYYCCCYYFYYHYYFFSLDKGNDEIICLMVTATRGRSWRDEIRIKYSRTDRKRISVRSVRDGEYPAGRKIGGFVYNTPTIAPSVSINTYRYAYRIVLMLKFRRLPSDKECPKKSYCLSFRLTNSDSMFVYVYLFSRPKTLSNVFWKSCMYKICIKI